MSTVRERIAWIIENRRMPDTGEAWDAQNLSLASGLSPAHIGMVLRKTIGEPRRPTLEKIARASGVSSVWLLTGEGEPGGAVAVEVRDPSPPATQTHEAEHPTDPAPPAIRVEPASESPLERALGAAFDHTRHSVGDLRAVQDALNDGLFPWQTIELDLVEAARTWLDAAAQMRREGQAVSTVGILFRVTLGNTPLAQELAAKRRAAMEAARTAPPRPPPMQAEESGPSGVRVIGESSSTAEPKTAKG